MHGCTHRWLAWTLAVAVGCGMTARAEAQQNPSTDYSMPVDDGRTALAQASQPGQNVLVSNNGYIAADQDLAKEVASLKADLKKIKDKAEADKKKAAGKPTVTVGGRLQWDTAAFSQNAESLSQAGDMINGTEFRRVRLFAKGDVSEVIDYKVQLDFAPFLTADNTTTGASSIGFRDVYMTIKELPMAGNVRFGQFYECYGLETQTSSNYITFMERSVINPVGGIGDRKPGVMMFDCNDAETMTWWVGGYAWEATAEEYGAFPGSNKSYNDNGGYALDMRATYLPWYDEATEGRGLLHTGIGYTYRQVATVTSPTATRYQIKARPDSHLAKYVIDTGNISDAERINAFNPELALVYGPFSVQTEYEWAFVDRSQHDTTPFDGGYITFSYFLTGENRTYSKREAVFNRVKPFENFFRVRDEDGYVRTGKGAWEVAYRADYLNLNEFRTTTTSAGRVVNQTVGLNWYLSPYARMMLNYVHSEATDVVAVGKLQGRAVADIVETRVQVDF